MDDTATVPTEEPLNVISTGVCGHSKSLGAIDGCIEALDHDWKFGGLTPSVLLICDIPESTKHIFFSGVPFVTTKEKVSEPSNWYCLATELLNIARSHYSNDYVTNSNKILLLFSDGGGDHNVAHISTQILLICLFYSSILTC